VRNPLLKQLYIALKHMPVRSQVISHVISDYSKFHFESFMPE